MTDDLMTIRQMCDAFDVTPRALRFYESKELLFPIREGQKRLFTARDRARLKLILRGKRFGFSLEELRQILDLYHADDSQQTQIGHAYNLAKKRIVEMVKRRDELNEAIEELQGMMSWAEQVLASADQSRAAE